MQIHEVRSPHLFKQVPLSNENLILVSFFELGILIAQILFKGNIKFGNKSLDTTSYRVYFCRALVQENSNETRPTSQLLPFPQKVSILSKIIYYLQSHRNGTEMSKTINLLSFSLHFLQKASTLSGFTKITCHLQLHGKGAEGLRHIWNHKPVFLLPFLGDCQTIPKHGMTWHVGPIQITTIMRRQGV